MVERREDLLDATYSALSHPVRRAVLQRVRGGDARVTELAVPFSISLAAVSKHIRVLEDAGLLSRTVRGRDHHLSLDPSPLRAAEGWLRTYEAFWEERLDALETKLRNRHSR